MHSFNSRVFLFLLLVLLLPAGKVRAEFIPVDSIEAYYKIYLDSGNTDQAWYYTNLLEKRAYETKSITLYFKAQVRKVNLYARAGKHDTALEIALLTYHHVLFDSYYKHPDRKKEKCRAILRLTRTIIRYVERIKRYETCINLLNRLEKLECFDHIKYYQFEYTRSRFLVLNNQPEEAIENMQNWVRTTQQMLNTNELIGAYNQLGIIARSAEQYPIAIEAFTHAINTIDSSGVHPKLKPVILGNIGSVYYKLENYDTAYYYLEQDVAGSIKAKELGSYFRAEINLIKIDTTLNNNSKAQERLNKLIGYKNHRNMSDDLKLEVFQMSYCFYQKTGQMKKASEMLLNYVQLTDSLHAARQQDFINIESTYASSIYSQTKKSLLREAEITNHKNQVLLREQEAIKRTNFLYFVIFCLVLTIGIILFLKYKSRQRLKEEIQLKELDLTKQHLHLEKTKKELLEIKVETEHAKLKSLALELITKNQFSELLITELKKIEEIPHGKIRELEILIRNELDLKNSQAKLQEEIDQLGEEFFQKLSETHPNLTDKEVKLCSMIALELSNKEIAISRNISPNSVKIAKNRLKKKLEIPVNDHLNDYLKSFIR